MSHCKIGKITFKDKNISSFRVESQNDDELKKALENLRICWERTGNVDGYLMIVWNKEGEFFRAMKNGVAIPMTLLPSWTAAVVRRWISEDSARDIMNGVI
jgi:hypothetical protein